MKNRLSPGRLLLWVSFLASLFSCQDHPITEPGTKSLRIDRVISGAGSDQVNTQYQFDENDRLLAINTYRTSDSIRTFVTIPFTYEGATVKGFERFDPGIDRPPVTGSFTRFEFNAAGQLTERTLYFSVTPPGNPIRVILERYEYDAQGNLNRIKQYNFAGLRTFFPDPLIVTVSDLVKTAPNALEVRSASYSRNGRIGFTCMECYLQEPATILYSLDRRVYDTNLNPFYGMFLFYPGAESNLVAFEPSNVIRHEYYSLGEVNNDWHPRGTPATSESRYVYNENRLPIKSERVGGDGATFYFYKPS